MIRTNKERVFEVPIMLSERLPMSLFCTLDELIFYILGMRTPQDLSIEYDLIVSETQILYVRTTRDRYTPMHQINRVQRYSDGLLKFMNISYYAISCQGTKNQDSN